MSYVKLFICFFLSLIFRSYAGEAFYAISSLRFYLENMGNESIKFENNDVAHLWEKAFLEDRTFSEIEKARVLYYDEGNCLEAVGLLRNAWEKILKQRLSSLSENDLFYPNFTDNALFHEQAKNAIRPYLLPLDHSMKPFLDEIFGQSRAIENENAFANAGFITISKYMRVARHPLLSEFLVKVYLDNEHRLNQEKRPGWLRLVDRCEGALNIKKLIEREDIQHFVVPDKMIYPLPMEPAPKELLDTEQQLAVLLVTDMELVSHEQCRDAWKNKITSKHLEELYLIISHGYASTYLAANIAYTKNGKFACVDTEFPQRKLHFEKVRHYLSDEMCEYWDHLVRSGGSIRAASI